MYHAEMQCSRCWIIVKYHVIILWNKIMEMFLKSLCNLFLHKQKVKSLPPPPPPKKKDKSLLSNYSSQCSRAGVRSNHVGMVRSHTNHPDCQSVPACVLCWLGNVQHTHVVLDGQPPLTNMTTWTTIARAAAHALMTHVYVHEWIRGKLLWNGVKCVCICTVFEWGDVPGQNLLI